MRVRRMVICQSFFFGEEIGVVCDGRNVVVGVGRGGDGGCFTVCEARRVG